MSVLIRPLHTAARRGETLALTWRHVDSEGQSAFFPLTKNGRSRTVPLRKEVIALFEKLPRTADTVLPLTTDYLKNAWARMLTEVGIEDLHIHDLRHEAISRIAETGKFTLIDLQAISGHRDVRMLLRYSHLCMSKLAARLDEVFANEDAKKIEERMTHRGRRRLSPGDPVSMREIVDEGTRGGTLDTRVPVDDAPRALKSIAATERGRVVTVNFRERRRVA